MTAFGVEPVNYAQLRLSVEFLKSNGAQFVDVPSELYLGTDYVAFAFDLDSHYIQLYYYMEWDGQVRSAAERRTVSRDWPAALEPLSDTHVDQVFQGAIRLTFLPGG
ncbi:MAG: hypothetical protein ACREFB_04900 [Stellaceae bacterium]